MKQRLTALILLCALLTGCAAAGKGEHPLTATVLAMDTVMNFTLYGGGMGEEQLRQALSGAEDTLRQLDAALTAQGAEGEAAALNAAGGAWTAVPQSGALLQQTLELAELTGGALDPTAYAAVKAWGFADGNYTVPNREELDALKAAIDYARVEVSQDGAQARLAPEQQLDFGATAKGYAGDLLRRQLEQGGITSALLDLGQSSIAAVGSKPDGSPWRIGIQDPAADSGVYLGVLELSGRSMGTSGSYQRYFDRDGVRYCHIIDPATASPARSGLAGVTVVADSCLLCDGLSTALFVMGLEEGVRFWRENSGLEFDVIFITDAGEIFVTSGLKDSFTLADGETREVQVLE